jgi:two-component system phosphate regulon response regulator PhoB
MSAIPVLAAGRDRSELNFLRLALSLQGIELSIAKSAEDALARAYATQPRAILVSLDLGAPALPLVRRFRSEMTTARTPVLVLASGGQDAEIAAALELGAMGTLSLPVDEAQAWQRVNEALSWRLPAGRDRILGVGPVLIDVDTRTVLRPHLQGPLTPCEFEILRWLLTPAGRAYTRRQLVAADRAAFPPSSAERNVDGHVASLRRKLGAAGEWIETMRGIGYRFAKPAAVEAGLRRNVFCEAPRLGAKQNHA